MNKSDYYTMTIYVKCTGRRNMREIVIQVIGVRVFMLYDITCGNQAKQYYIGCKSSHYNTDKID